MKSYLSVYSAATYEKVIERSRFIANCVHAESEEEARAFVEKIRAEHPLATHNCFAFVADDAGNLLRFSDDGEPQGTAGMPILEVLRGKKLMQTAVVVTRYFGGIKLGAGGLVRAYSSAAAEALAGADIREYRLCRELRAEVGYDAYDALRKFLDRAPCFVRDTEYTGSVAVKIAVAEEEKGAFSASLIDNMAGKVLLQEGGTFLFPFPQQK